MAGRRRSKRGGSGDAGVGFLILFIVGLFVTYWKQILLLIVIVGIAVCIYLVLKQVGRRLIERRVSFRNSQQKAALPEPMQSMSLTQATPEKAELVNEAKPTTIHLVSAAEQTAIIQEVIDPKQAGEHPIFTPRPSPDVSEHLEAKLRELEEKIKGR